MNIHHFTVHSLLYKVLVSLGYVLYCKGLYDEDFIVFSFIYSHDVTWSV